MTLGIFDIKMDKIFEMLQAIWWDDPHHLVRFLAMKNDGMVFDFHGCTKFGCDLEFPSQEECKECSVHDISDFAPYLKRLYKMRTEENK